MHNRKHTTNNIQNAIALAVAVAEKETIKQFVRLNLKTHRKRRTGKERLEQLEVVVI
jgi:hypothetical protein